MTKHNTDSLKQACIRQYQMSEAKETGPLSLHFPLIRSRQEIITKIKEKPELNDIFQQWNQEAQNEFLDICSGVKGLKIVYDGVFREIFNPEATPERLEQLLTLLFEKEIHIEAVLPNDTVRLGAESSLLYTDILIQQNDGSLCNVEIQKIGYAFPGQRSACYSADHLLRQYKKIRGEKGKHFNYKDIKQVYTIVFFEHSPSQFSKFPGHFCHKFRQKSDSGLELELLQEYFFLPLDIFRKSMENKAIETELEAWLVFLSFDEPDWIIKLITEYPEFKTMYQQLYEMCLNMEKVMSVYSKELAELDRNTVLYMIDEMQAEIDRKSEELNQLTYTLEQKKCELDQKNSELDQKTSELDQKTSELDQKTSELDQKTSDLKERNKKIKELEDQIRQLQSKSANN